jgi:tetratricopeptide (TPR) repeat protein
MASALIARHFDGAGEKERSVEFYFRAADEALDQYGAAESLRLCDKVLERVDEDSEFYYKTLKTRAKALKELGLRDECRHVLEEIETLAFERDDICEQADVLIQQARFLFDESELRQARDYAQRARELAEECEDLLHVADSWLVEAMIYMNEGNRDEALELGRRAIEAFSDLTDAPGGVEGLVRAHNVVGVVHRQAGRHHDALEAYEEALVVAEEAELRKWRRYLLNNAGLALAYLGEFTTALERYNEALERVRQLGHRTEESNLLINIGHCHLLRGEYDEAMRAVRRGIYLARKTNAVHNLADGLISMGAIHVEKGDTKKAERSLHEGLRLADSIPNVYLSVHATLLLARAHLSAGANDAAKIALMQAEDALERSEKAEMKWGMGYAHSLMARALKILGKRERAIEESERAVALVDEGEVFALEDILYHHTQILPDEDEYEDDRRQAITRAREVIIHRRDKIEDDEVRKTYMSKPMNRQIFNVAKLLLE